MKKLIKGKVYALYGINQNDIFYIGSTFNTFQRYQSHNAALKNGHEPIYGHLRTNGLNVNMMVIEEYQGVDKDELKRHEDYWIEQFRQWGFKLKNVSGNISHKWGKKIRPTNTLVWTGKRLDALEKENDYFGFTDVLEKAGISRSSLYRMIRDDKIRKKQLGIHHVLYSLKDVINNKPRKNANK